jgi:hypothetical protein
MGVAHKMLQIAEPIQLGVPLSNFLAPHEQGRAFMKAGNEDFIVPLLWIL